MNNILTVEDLSLAYGSKVVINHLNLALKKGEFKAIIGENGVGKTTFIRALLGQLTPQSGCITFEDASLKIGYVPQFRNLDEEYPLSIINFVGLNLMTKKAPWPSKHERLKLQRVIDDTNLTDVCKRPIGVASGGEKQRAYLAQALVNDPDLLILDESTASLDNVVKVDLLDLVSDFQKTRNLSVLFITHDWPLARKYADSFLLMKPMHYISGAMNDFPIYKIGEIDV